MRYGTKIENEIIKNLSCAGCIVKNSTTFFDHLKIDCFLENIVDKDLQITAVQITTWIGKADKFIEWVKLMRACFYCNFYLYLEVVPKVTTINEQIGKSLFNLIRTEVWASNVLFHVFRLYPNRIEILNFQRYYDRMLKSINRKSCDSFKDDFNRTFIKGVPRNNDCQTDRPNAS